MKILSTSYPEVGGTKLGPIDPKLARQIADYFYDALNVWAMPDDPAQNSVAGTFSVQTIGGYAAIIGTIEGKPAILHKHNGERELNILE